jgi:hypothetical protein
MKLHREIIFQKQSGPLLNLCTHHWHACSFFHCSWIRTLGVMCWNTVICRPSLRIMDFSAIISYCLKRECTTFYACLTLSLFGSPSKIHNCPWTQGGVQTPCTGPSFIHHIPFSVRSISIFQILPIGIKFYVSPLHVVMHFHFEKFHKHNSPLRPIMSTRVWDL